jgi:Ran GTPase-activating protein (RanGAP) involved in mRNA processing and transport
MGNNIGAQGAKALAQVLKEKSTVTSINLSFNNIGDEGVKALADALQVNKTLIELNLQRNQIGDEGAVALAQVLKEKSTVTSINLMDNDIGDQGAEALAQVLEVNSTVTSIYLSFNNNIGDQGAEALALALEKNTTVTHLTLNLNGNGIGKEISDKINQLIERNKKIATIKTSLLEGAEIVRMEGNKISINGDTHDKEVLVLAIKSIVKDLEPDANESHSKKSRKKSITNELKDKNKSNHLYFLARILNSLNAHGEKIFSDNEINILIEEFVESDELIKSINAISRTISSSKQILREYKQDKENTGCSSRSSSKFLSLSTEDRSCIFYQMLPPKTKEIFTKKVNHRDSASIEGSEMQEGDDQINDSTEVIESQEVKNIDQINIKKLESFIKIFTPEINEKINEKINGKMDINYIINHDTRYDLKPDPASTIHPASNEASLKGRNVGR